MKYSKIMLGAALIGVVASSIFAQETLRSLAEERDRYIGAILNSEWFNNSIEPEFEEIHKAQFNAVVAENEMKFDATEPSMGKFSYSKGDRMVEYAKANKMRVRGHALAKALAEYDVVLNITELDVGFPQGSAKSLGASDYAKQGHLYRQFMDVFLEEPNMGACFGSENSVQDCRGAARFVCHYGFYDQGFNRYYGFQHCHTGRYELCHAASCRSGRFRCRHPS